jgi:hypothetical protein
MGGDKSQRKDLAFTTFMYATMKLAYIVLKVVYTTITRTESLARGIYMTQ